MGKALSGKLYYRGTGLAICILKSVGFQKQESWQNLTVDDQTENADWHFDGKVKNLPLVTKSKHKHNP